MAGGGGGGGSAPSSPVTFIPSRCRRDDPQAVPTAPIQTDIAFQTLVYPDVSALIDFSFTPGINPYEIINEGIYVIASGLALSGNPGGDYRHSVLIIDGLPIDPPHGNFDTKTPGGLWYTAHNLYTEMELLAGWKVGVQCYQNSGVELSVDIFPDSPWLSLRRIR